jgi:hypothetical protein
MSGAGFLGRGSEAQPLRKKTAEREKQSKCFMEVVPLGMPIKCANLIRFRELFKSKSGHRVAPSLFSLRETPMSESANLQFKKPEDWNRSGPYPLKFQQVSDLIRCFIGNDLLCLTW